MSQELILITGATGFIGYRTLVEALAQGYTVRAAVRSEEKATVLKSAAGIQPFLSRLSFVVVPDIKQEDAYLEAASNVAAIIHCASPITVDESMSHQEIISPALGGTLNLLKAALRQRSVKRVVITSSLAAVAPTEQRVFTANNVEPTPVGPYKDAFTAYSASKKLALHGTRKFIAQHDPMFTIINIVPSFVIGKNELATTRAAITCGSNRRALGPLLGHKTTALPGAMCHIDDVAYVHIAVLKQNIERHTSLGVNYDYTQNLRWNDAIPIVQKHFPSAVETGLLPLGGATPTSPLAFNASHTENLLGIKFKSHKDMILSIVNWYIEVSQSENLSGTS